MIYINPFLIWQEKNRNIFWKHLFCFCFVTSTNHLLNIQILFSLIPMSTQFWFRVHFCIIQSHLFNQGPFCCLVKVKGGQKGGQRETAGRGRKSQRDYLRHGSTKWCFGVSWPVGCMEVTTTKAPTASGEETPVFTMVHLQLTLTGLTPIFNENGMSILRKEGILRIVVIVCILYIWVTFNNMMNLLLWEVRQI